MMAQMIWYFAYGSNMKISRLRNRNISFTDYRTGYLTGYTFRYNKIGTDQTGKGNIIPSTNSKVWGIFFRITQSDYHFLHKKYESGYRQIDIQGISNNEPITGKSFQATGQNTSKSIQPSQKYRELVVKGAKEKVLPNTYINTLRGK